MDYWAFANTERLKYKQEWREGEKAGKVSLLRDIDITNPHAGHVRIINDLKIPDSGKNKVDSFAKLYAYWQDVFSVSILNKKFYQELSNWYFWAVKEVSFPSEPTAADEHLKNIDLAALRQEHNAKNVIRLLTRFLFVWFVKEKKLIPEELFDIDYLKNELLKDLSPVRDDGLFKQANIESVYYKAILQNLFFASLNCPIEPSGDGDNRKRAFRLKDNYGQHRDANYLMRYQGHFKNPEKFTELINGIVPFLNGGLFECLDNKTDKIYIDGFSDNLVKPHQLIVPDYLFFGFDHEVDLSGVVGISTKAFKNARVKGLISILESYKFTIAENTPIEEDVALDPELLGKVFENLLASYNPETKTTARKQTGSFYTPREIVNYMVDESLIAYLKNSVKNWDIEAEELDKQLHDLLSYDAVNPFAENNDLQKQIIHALDNCKILDPACGSGAFPMGILQKMVHILQKVDPENKYWQELQLNKAVKETEGAFAITDKKEREQKLIEINEAFDEKINDPDYARKLFLVENCIYGVDIQEIAAQISKLRFFISLIVDQKVDKTKPNFGIRALPNLETKFVAANTLIGIEKTEAQMTLFDNQEIKELEQELKNVRHRLFSAKSPATKRRLRDKDKEIREKIGNLLVKHGWGNETAKQLAGWDPYDQNASSPFFDPEWMFDIKDGFDVVIGNPPYITLALGKKQTIFNKEEIDLYRKKYPDVFEYKGNTFALFIKASNSFLKNGGVLSFILPNTLLLNASFRNLRKHILSTFSITKLLNFKNDVFEAAVTGGNLVILFEKGEGNKLIQVSTIENEQSLNSILFNFIEIDFYQNSPTFNFITNLDNFILKEKIRADSRTLGEVAIFYNGIKTGNNKKYLSGSRKSPNYYPVIRGRDVHRYQIIFGNTYVLFDKKLLWSNTNQTNLLKEPKIVIRQTGDSLIAALDTRPYMSMDTTHLIFDCIYDIKYILAIINSKLMNWYYQSVVSESNRTFAEVKIVNLKKLPIKKSSTPAPIIELVGKVLDAKAKNKDTRALEKQIDEHIYRVYNLSKEDIRTIEGMNN